MVLYFTGRKSVEHQIVINATPSEVWNVLTDTKAYPEWNPVMLLKNGEIENGSRLLYEFTQDKNTKSEISITVKEITPNKLLNQVGGIPFILTFNHTYTLVPNGDATKVIIHEDYNGIGVNFWNPQPVEIAYGRLNEALKKRVEFLN